MKSKIKEALQTEYKNLGLSEKSFDGVSTLLEKTVTQESEIATAIKGAEIKSLLTAIQGEGDRSRSEKSALQQQFEAYKLAHPESTPSVPPTPATTPPASTGGETLTAEKIAELFQIKIQEVIQPITDKIGAIEKERSKASILSQAAQIRDALKMDPKQKAWIDDAWEHATQSLSDSDTPQAIADRCKSRYDVLMSKLGVNGYIPATSTPGADKSNTERIIEQIKEKAKTTEVPLPLAERVKTLRSE